MRKKSGFTIVEALLAISITLVVTTSIVSLLYFFGRTLNTVMRDGLRRSKVDIIVNRLSHDLLNTFRKDPLNNLVHPIEKISDDGKEIVFRVITPCSTGSDEVVESGTSGFCWGDGFHVDWYIRVYQDDQDVIWLERWDGNPTSGGTLKERYMLLDGAELSVVGLDSSGDNVNNYMPVVIRISVQDKLTSYLRTVQVKLRGL